MNATLSAAAAVASLAAVSLCAWLATLATWTQRLAAVSALALATWWLMPVALDTGLRDLSRALVEDGWARDLAALATLDGMLVAALAARALWGATGRRERWLLRMPPLATPVAAFGLCLLAAQAADTLDFGSLRTGVALACIPGLAAAAGLLAAALPGTTAVLELRLASALLLVLAAAVLAGLATAAPQATAPAVDGTALGAILGLALLVGAAGFAWERRRARR